MPFEKGHKYQSWKGRKHTEETKQKMREARLKNNPMHNPEVVAKRSKTIKNKRVFVGKNNNNWKGGITPETIKIRNGGEMRKWRKSVIARDNNQCRNCGINYDESILHAHHLKSFADYPELRFDINNGVALCKNCHYEAHTNAKN